MGFFRVSCATRWCVRLAAGVPPGLPAIGRLLINYKHWPHLGPPGSPTSCQPAAARARRRASPALGTVHLALCLCHSIPPAPAAFSIPVLPRQLLCLIPLLPLHRLGVPLFLLLLPCFSSFLSCYHSPHAPVLCLPASCSSIREGGRPPVGPRCPARPDPPSPYCLVSSVHPVPVLPDPIPAVRSGIALRSIRGNLMLLAS